MQLYVPLSILVIVLAAALYPPRVIACLGGLAVACYLALVPGLHGVDSTLIAGLGTLLAIMGGLSAATAANRRRLEARRRIVERRTETLLENASDAVVAIAPGGEVTYASPSVRQVFGLEPGHLTGAKLAELLHPDDLPVSTKWLTGLYTAPTDLVARTECADPPGRRRLALRRRDRRPTGPPTPTWVPRCSASGTSGRAGRWRRS